MINKQALDKCAQAADTLAKTFDRIKFMEESMLRGDKNHIQKVAFNITKKKLKFMEDVLDLRINLQKEAAIFDTIKEVGNLGVSSVQTALQVIRDYGPLAYIGIPTALGATLGYVHHRATDNAELDDETVRKMVLLKELRNTKEMIQDTNRLNAMDANANTKAEKEVRW